MAFVVSIVVGDDVDVVGVQLIIYRAILWLMYRIEIDILPRFTVLKTTIANQAKVR